MRSGMMMMFLLGLQVSSYEVSSEGYPGLSGRIHVTGQGRGEAVWHRIGQNVSEPWRLHEMFPKGLFEVLKVNVTSVNAANIRVMFNGGTPLVRLDPPHLSSPLYQSVYRKYCAGWFGGGDSVNCENVVLPRYSIWAPFGQTQIAVTQDATDNFAYTITYHKEYEEARAIRLGVGMFLFLFGSVFSHSRPIHLLIGALLGSVGFFLVLLFVGMRMVPGGNKPLFVMMGAASATFTAWLYNNALEALSTHVVQYAHYYACTLGLGAFFGFGYAYKHELDSNSRFLCLLLLRIIAVGLIVLGGPTSYLVSFGLIAVMCFLLLLNRCGCCSWVCGSGQPDPPIPEPQRPEAEESLPREEPLDVRRVTAPTPARPVIVAAPQPAYPRPPEAKRVSRSFFFSSPPPVAEPVRPPPISTPSSAPLGPFVFANGEPQPTAVPFARPEVLQTPVQRLRDRQLRSLYVEVKHELLSRKRLRDSEPDTDEEEEDLQPPEKRAA